MSEPIDHVENTTSAVPGPRRNVVRDTGEQLGVDVYMAVYAEGLNLIEGEAQELDRWLNEWDREGADTPQWILDIIGRQIGLPRPDGAEDLELFRRLLKLQVIARTSGGKRECIRELFDAIAAPGGTSVVSFPGWSHIVVTLTDADPLSLLPAIDDIIIAAIGEVDSIDITQAVGGTFFTFGVEGLGFDQGVFL